MKIKLTSNIEVYNFCEPYIIAELGSNHNGDMELAKKLIFEAKKAGANCVKFQSWTKNTIFSKQTYQDNFFLNDDYRNRTDFTLEDIVDNYSISEDELLQMKEYADEIGITCTSTPFSKKEVDFLVDVMKTPFIKVASMDLNNYPFLEYIAKKGKPIVISTGLSELHEINRAIQVIEESGNREIVILHCVSIYPPEDSQVNLNIIDTLMKLYEYPIGFSDHTLGVSIPLASVVKGVCLIEKHFTLDKNMVGWDHKVSATPEEMKTICIETKRINTALGTNRIKSVETDERKQAFRRSIVINKDIKAGQVLKESDLDFKRPGNGIAPEFLNFVVGRTVKEDIENDKVLNFSDLI